MPISRFTKISETMYKLDTGEGPVSIDLSALAIPLDAAQVEKLRQVVQALLDTRQKVRDLPDDDPAKTTDPGRANYFWEGQGGNKDLVSRVAEVLVRWRPTGGGFDFVIKRPGVSGGFMDFEIVG